MCSVDKLTDVAEETHDQTRVIDRIENLIEQNELATHVSNITTNTLSDELNIDNKDSSEDILTRNLSQKLEKKLSIIN